MDKPGTPTSQQFCLRWHNHTSSLLSSLPGLLDQSHLADVTLSAEGRTIKAHKIILSACSTFFAELFKNLDAAPHQHPVIILPGTPYTSIVALMQFMYAGEVNVFEEQISNLLSLAETLGIKGLADFNNGKSPSKSDTSLSSPQREKDTESPPSTPKQHSPLENFFSRSLNLFPHIMTEPINYSNSRGHDLLARLSQTASQLKMSSSPNGNKSNSQNIDENGNIDERNKSPFTGRRTPTTPTMHHHHPHHQQHPSKTDLKRIDKIAETLRTVTGKNYFDHSTSSSNKSCTMIPHSPPASLALKPPTFPPVTNFPTHFLSDEPHSRTPETLMFDQQSQMLNENLCAESLMDKPALPKPSNPKLYATCFICNKKLSNQYNLRVHLETHQNMRYACQVCNHVSRSKDALRKHVSYRHPGTSTCDPDARRKRNRLNTIPIPLSPSAQATMMMQQASMQANMFMPASMMNVGDPSQFIKHETSIEPPAVSSPSVTSANVINTTSNANTNNNSTNLQQTGIKDIEKSVKTEATPMDNS